MKTVRTLVILLALVCLLLSSHVYAQQSGAGENTITAEPAQLDFEVNENNEDISHIVTLTNQYDVPVELAAEFKSIDEDAGRIIPTNELSQPLASALSLSSSTFSIPAHSHYFLTVGLRDVDMLPAGGQYATLVLTQLVKQKANQDVVQPQLSIGIFVTKMQGREVKVLLGEHALIRKRFRFPTKLKIGLLNDGNVHIVPRGYVRLYDKNRMYFETVVNQQSQLLLPKKQFEQTINIPKIEHWLPTKLNFEMGYRAEGVDEVKLYREEFWYIPSYLFWVIALMTGLLGLAAYRFGWRRKIKKS